MLETYINKSWDTLLRNSLDVALDPKVSGGMRSYLYISPDEDAAAINTKIIARRSRGAETGTMEVRVLKATFDVGKDHGILYLPNPYVVPGGRFNEMYGWDSYWIILGLMADGRGDLALGMVENFVYQILHYGGKVLNANRTYYLTRSQPPVLMISALAALPAVPDRDRAVYLKRVAAAAATEYDGFWKKERFDKQWGLFRYGHIDQGALGLCDETTFGERDETGLSHYDKIAAHLRSLAPDDILRQRFIDKATGNLSLEGIAGDRAMRESGFDASMHMGYYGLETMDYHPVCLNTLLYMQCKLLGDVYGELGEQGRSQYFRHEASEIRARIQQYMWNEDSRLFLNFNHRDNRPSEFPYLTCVYPLWAGIATPLQARYFRDRLRLFETPFGIRGTDRRTGCQWDAPFMWAPLVYFAVAGLHRYGFDREAKRIARKFIDIVRLVNEATGANFEKYNADTGSIRTEGIVAVGYSENVVGFGWTNGGVRILQEWLANAAGRPAAQLAPDRLLDKGGMLALAKEADLESVDAAGQGDARFDKPYKRA
jgi:alpha,alpha-trehalase